MLVLDVEVVIVVIERAQRRRLNLRWHPLCAVNGAPIASTAAIIRIGGAFKRPLYGLIRRLLFRDQMAMIHRQNGRRAANDYGKEPHCERIGIPPDRLPNIVELVAISIALHHPAILRPQHHGAHRRAVRSVQRDGVHEKGEIFIISLSDTRSHPRTVVVELANTAIADCHHDGVQNTKQQNNANTAGRR